MSPPSGTATPDKATLFCPSCSYQSHVEGEWERVRTVRATRYRCPDCGVEVTSRPHAVSDGLAPDPGTVVVTYWETVSASTRVWQRFWSRTITRDGVGTSSRAQPERTTFRSSQSEP